MSPPLPPELYDAVFRFLDHRDLAVVARASPTTHAIALRVLYRVLHVSNPSPSVVLTLASRPHIARHVRHFSIALDPAAALFHSFYRRLATALAAMTALVSLDIFIDAGSWVLPDNRVYPQLQHFASSFAFDPRVAAFLAQAPALESVQVGPTVSPRPSLAPASLLRLVEFTGCSSAAVAVIPGRPVESIHINSGDLTEDLVPALAKSTALVTVLSLTTSSAPVAMLQVLGQHMPHIMYLRITSSCGLSAPPMSIFYEQVAGALAFFTNLQSFELSGMAWSSTKKPHNQQRVWQSQPFSPDFAPQDEAEMHLDLYSNTTDFFFS